MTVWDELKEFARRRGFPHGHIIETTLLGGIEYRRFLGVGPLEPYISESFKREAQQNGFAIEGFDQKREVYFLRLS